MIHRNYTLFCCLLFSESVFSDYELELDITTINYWNTITITRPVKPSYLSSYIDAVHDTTVNRVSGDLGISIPNTSNAWSSVHKHGYSKRPAFNVDGSLIQLEKGGRYFLDGSAYNVLYKRSAPAPNARWHPTKPNAQYYIDDDGEIGEWDVQTDTITSLFTLSGYSEYDISGKGNWSDNGQYVAVEAKRDSDGKTVYFKVDMHAQSKSVDIVQSSNSANDNYIVSSTYWTISPLGTYLFMIGDFGDGGGDRIKVWNADSGVLVDHESLYGMPSHCDLAIDENGDEVAVGVAKSDSGAISKWTTIKRRLSDGQLTTLLDKSGAHYSTRNLKRPGWVYMSVQSEASMYTGDSNPYTGEVVAIKLDGSRHERLAIMHGGDRDIYDQEHHASPSWDGTKIIFASDWGVDTADVDWQAQAYVVDASTFVKPTVRYDFASSNCADFTDTQGNADDGEFIGAVTCNTSGVYLNNNDYGIVYRNHIEAFMPGNDFSVSIWVRLASTPATGERQLLNYASSYILKYTDPDLKFVIDTADNGGSYGSLVADDVLQEGVYHHIVASYDGQTMKLYVDNVLEVETMHAGKIDNPNKDLLIGGTTTIGTSHKGHLDDIRLFDVALTPQAIEKLYNSGRQ